MKKLFSLILALTLVMLSVSCGSDEEYTQLNTDQTAAATASATDFSIINDLGEGIKEFYISQSETSDWGENLLGTTVLDDGAQLDLAFDGAPTETTVFDIAIIMEDEQEYQFEKIDVSDSKMIKLQMTTQGPVAAKS